MFQIESSAFALIMYTAGSKMLFLGYLKGPLSALYYLMISFISSIKLVCTIFADDNSLSSFESNTKNLKLMLESESKTAILWFRSFQMSVNPGKFQGIIIDKKKQNHTAEYISSFRKM